VFVCSAARRQPGLQLRRIKRPGRLASTNERNRRRLTDLANALLTTVVERGIDPGIPRGVSVSSGLVRRPVMDRAEPVQPPEERRSTECADRHNVLDGVFIDGCLTPTTDTNAFGPCRVYRRSERRSRPGTVLNTSAELCKQTFSLRRRAAYPLWSYQAAIDLDHFAAVAGHVQHQSAAAVAPPTDRPRPLMTSSTGQKTFSDPAATSLATDQMVAGNSMRTVNHSRRRPRSAA
jgi:hypothetical protein